ncbi:MAG: S-methyl-5-thioribose-1-phosphate isomerase [Fimbriimonadales bacterium]|nr:S-methyl-5-thioribose-1-phosphate isomerase [Fimbriimonadales bacterium]
MQALRFENGILWVLDQRHVPEKEVWLPLQSWEEVADAIRVMAVRGAPLIGVAGGYGLAMAFQAGEDGKRAFQVLSETRPTAVNLFKALERVARAPDPIAEADQILREEETANELISERGSELLPEEAVVMTLCNTGSLATPGLGTALGIIKRAFQKGRLKQAVVLETRPRLQGLRLTAFELMQEGVPFTVIPDGSAGWWLRKRGASAVVVGADRIAANGDTANKVGTYALAVLAREHKVPFIVAAPLSTIDPQTPTGEAIPIEERSEEEITRVGSQRVAPEGCPVWNPAFDVTPADLISHIVTPAGVFSPPYDFRGVV